MSLENCVHSKLVKYWFKLACCLPFEISLRNFPTKCNFQFKSRMAQRYFHCFLLAIVQRNFKPIENLCNWRVNDFVREISIANFLFWSVYIWCTFHSLFTKWHGIYSLSYAEHIIRYMHKERRPKKKKYQNYVNCSPPMNVQKLFDFSLVDCLHTDSCVYNI